MDMNIGNNLSGIAKMPGLADIPQVQTEGTGALPNQILFGPAVKVTGTNWTAALDKLANQVEESRKNLAAAQFSATLSAVLGRIEVTDAKQRELLEEIGKLVDHQKDDELALLELAESMKTQITPLEIKVRELEEAVKRMRKTPEEQRTEAEKKELAQAEAELDAAKSELIGLRLEYTRKSQAIQADLTETLNQIKDKVGQLDELSTSVLTTALRETASNFGQDDPAIEWRKREHDPNAPDVSALFLKLLGGDDILDAIDRSRIETPV